MVSGVLFGLSVVFGIAGAVFILAALDSSWRCWRAGGVFGPYNHRDWTKRALERMPAEARPHMERAIRLGLGGFACMFGMAFTRDCAEWLS